MQSTSALFTVLPPNRSPALDLRFLLVDIGASNTFLAPKPSLDPAVLCRPRGHVGVLAGHSKPMSPKKYVPALQSNKHSHVQPNSLSTPFCMSSIWQACKLQSTFTTDVSLEVAVCPVQILSMPRPCVRNAFLACTASAPSSHSGVVTELAHCSWAGEVANVLHSQSWRGSTAGHAAHPAVTTPCSSHCLQCSLRCRISAALHPCQVGKHELPKGIPDFTCTNHESLTPLGAGALRQLPPASHSQLPLSCQVGCHAS